MLDLKEVSKEDSGKFFRRSFFEHGLISNFSFLRLCLYSGQVEVLGT